MIPNPYRCETCTEIRKCQWQTRSFTNAMGCASHSSAATIPEQEGYIITEEQFRPMIIALFRRIGKQLELKDEWKKLPNAERNAMAGDFYNVITGCSHSYTHKRLRDTVLQNIPDILICQSLPNEHGFCGDNDCICKNIEIVESGDMCKGMQSIRRQQGGEQG